MSYHRAAAKINRRLSEITDDMDEETLKQLVNAIIWFGQVSKFRCKNNTAYDSFCNAVFTGMVKLKRYDHGLGFPVLQVDDEFNVDDLVEKL
jgi:hypothetical protein